MSDGFFSEATISSKTADLENAYNFVKKLNNISDDIYLLTLSDGMQVLIDAISKYESIKNCKYLFWSPIILNHENTVRSNKVAIKPQRDKITNNVCIPFLGLWISLKYLNEKKHKDFYGEFLNVRNELQSNSAFFYAGNDNMVKDSIDILENYGFNVGYKTNDGGHSFCTHESHSEIIEKTVKYLESDIKGRYL